LVIDPSVKKALRTPGALAGLLSPKRLAKARMSGMIMHELMLMQLLRHKKYLISM
jgi:hypothetical protein